MSLKSNTFFYVNTSNKLSKITINALKSIISLDEDKKPRILHLRPCAFNNDVLTIVLIHELFIGER